MISPILFRGIRSNLEPQGLDQLTLNPQPVNSGGATAPLPGTNTSPTPPPPDPRIRPLYPNTDPRIRPLYPEGGTTDPRIRPLYPEGDPRIRPLYPEPSGSGTAPINTGIVPPGAGSAGPGAPGAPVGGTGTSGPTGPGTGINTGGPNMGIPGGLNQFWQLNQPPLQPPGEQFSPYRVTTDNLNNLLSSENTYIQNARQRGREAANNRGLLNSSISAGASERAGIEAAMPILDQIMGLTGQRESMANTSLENQRNRQFQAEFAAMDAQMQDWLSNQQFNREFNGQLAMMPIASAADMWSGLMQLAASDPTVFTPTVLAGYQDFFQRGFNEYISRYLRPVTPGGG